MCSAFRCLPEQAAEENISSREFLKKAEFINVESLVKGESDDKPAGGGASGGNTSGSGSGQNTGGNQGGSNEPIGD